MSIPDRLPEPEPDDREGRALSRLTDGDASKRDRVSAMRTLAGSLGTAVSRPSGLADAVTRLTPSLSSRSAEELARDYPGLSRGELAEAVITSAARTSAAIGAAAGALASASEAAPVALVSAPVQLGVESLAVVAVEVKMIAELHEVMGRPLPTDRVRRASLLLRSWTSGRGLSLSDVTGGPGIAQVVTRAARSRLANRLLRRFLRSTLSFVPLLAGAAIGAVANSKGTRKLGERILADLG